MFLLRQLLFSKFEATYVFVRFVSSFLINDRLCTTCMLFLLLEYGLGYVFFGITTDRSRERSLTLSSRIKLFYS